MAQPLFGPIYCEDAFFVPGVFPAEPVNTISNLIIVLFGFAAVAIVSRKSPRAYDLYALSLLQIATGIGSGLWHGLREPWALALDVIPGLIFLFAVLFCWARRLWSSGGAVLFLAAFFMTAFLSERYWPIAQRWIAIAPAVVLACAALISQTYPRSRGVALKGALALASALVALFFRSIDLAACALIPFGTHFLWHGFLSAAGFIGIIAMTEFPASVKAGPVPAE